MIIVTGATGQLGRAIVDALLQQVPPGEIGVSVRDPGKAADIAARGVRVRRGDFSEPESLADAFDGAEQVVMISSNARSVGGDPIAQHAAAIAAAGRAGARRIVYTSHMARGPIPRFRRRVTTPRRKSCSAHPASRGRRCGTVFTLRARSDCSGTFERPASWSRPRTGRFRGPRTPISRTPQRRLRSTLPARAGRVRR